MKSNLPTIDNFISEYHLPYESLIGAWFIPESECDTIIDLHKKHVVEKDKDIDPDELNQLSTLKNIDKKVYELQDNYDSTNEISQTELKEIDRITYTNDLTKLGTNVASIPNPINAVSNYEYETLRNEEKRNIYVLKNGFLQQFLDDFREIMTYDESSQRIDDNTAQTENLNISMP